MTARIHPAYRRVAAFGVCAISLATAMVFVGVAVANDVLATGWRRAWRPGAHHRMDIKSRSSASTTPRPRLLDPHAPPDRDRQCSDGVDGAHGPAWVTWATNWNPRRFRSSRAAREGLCRSNRPFDTTGCPSVNDQQNAAKSAAATLSRRCVRSDGGLDLGARADDAGVVSRRQLTGEFGAASDGARAPKCLALQKHDGPRQAGLKASASTFPGARCVDTPHSVVIGLHQRVAAGPGAPGGCRSSLLLPLRRILRQPRGQARSP